MLSNLFGETIYTYTRAQAIDDGELIDVTEIANEAGLKVPVALTREVWDAYVSWDESDTNNQTYQDESGRLWDVVWMLRMASHRYKNTSTALYELFVVPRDGRSFRPKKVQLKAVISGGDHGEPVITVMLPNED